MSTSVRYVGFSQGSQPRPQLLVDIGTNDKYTVFVANDAALLQPGPGRNSSNFFVDLVQHPGISDYALPDRAWNNLDQSTGTFHAQVISYTATNGNRQESQPISFDFLPHVSAVNPARGPVSGGTRMTVTGHAFSYLAGIEVGGIAVQPISANDRAIVIDTPSNAVAGEMDVLVRTSFGVSQTHAGSKFSYEALPALARSPPRSAEIVDLRVVPETRPAGYDTERLFGDATVLRRGRRYRIEVVYAHAFQNPPDAFLDIGTSGTPLRVSLLASPSEPNVAQSDPIYIR